MIIPKSLKYGDTIALFAPARAVREDELSDAISILESWGLKVKLPDLLFETDNQFAGDTQVRVKQVQSVLDDSEIKAMIAVRGGYGCSKIIDELDFSSFIKHPKWLVGFSDLTVFLGELFNLNVLSVHGPIALLLGQGGGEESAKRLKEVLFSAEPIVELTSLNSRFSLSGDVEGDLVGGNLSVLVNQIGTSSFPVLDGNILFLEDLDEYLYHIDRMITQLERIGAFQRVAGVVIGYMSGMHDNATPFGRDAEKIISDVLTKHNVPFATGFPVGHEASNYSLIVGGKAHLVVGKGKASLINKSI